MYKWCLTHSHSFPRNAKFLTQKIVEKPTLSVVYQSKSLDVAAYMSSFGFCAPLPDIDIACNVLQLDLCSLGHDDHTIFLSKNPSHSTSNTLSSSRLEIGFQKVLLADLPARRCHEAFSVYEMSPVRKGKSKILLRCCFHATESRHETCCRTCELVSKSIELSCRSTFVFIPCSSHQNGSKPKQQPPCKAKQLQPSTRRRWEG